MSTGYMSGERTMLLVWFLSVIFQQVLGIEESVSINKPRTRAEPPLSWTQISTDQVRCFCNLPPCVATGYMCKSSRGGCFSDVLHSSKTTAYRGRHGCIEYLSEAQRSRCSISDKDGQIHTQDKDQHRSLLVCCTNDMCNHIDNPSTRNLLNSTLLVEDSEPKFQHQNQETYLYSNAEVWFRAATIAVPICGGVILLVLIGLAVRILKNENQNSLQNKLGPAMYVVPTEQKHTKWSDHPYKPCSMKTSYYNQVHPNTFVLQQEEDIGQMQFQMPLLVPDDMSEYGGANSTSSESKNDTNAKMNLMQCQSNSSKSIIMEIGKGTPDYSVVNMNLNNDKFCKNDKTLIS